jgi:PAS domain S-box-containing protein
VGYVGLDREGIILAANLRAADMLGFSKDKMIGQSFSRFIYPEDRENYSGLVLETFEKRGENLFGEIRLQGLGAQPFYARLELNGSLENHNDPAVLRIAFLDISAQKEAERKLKNYAQKLERSNQELEDFAFIASHDLNEPLRKIQAFGERLQKKFAPVLGQEGLDHVIRMRGATKRLQDMIGGLLASSRGAAGGAGFLPVDLEQLVCSVLSDLEWQIEKNGAQVSLEDLPTLEADPGQMRRLFQNLISNALKFHGKEPIVIKISGSPLRVDDNKCDCCRIIVEDNGIGFEQINAERIFSLFERLHGRSAYEGTGMGLAICRRIVERHGGSITAKSVPGKGAAITITLPARQEKNR